MAHHAALSVKAKIRHTQGIYIYISEEDIIATFFDESALAYVVWEGA